MQSFLLATQIFLSITQAILSCSVPNCKMCQLHMDNSCEECDFGYEKTYDSIKKTFNCEKSEFSVIEISIGIVIFIAIVSICLACIKTKKTPSKKLSKSPSRNTEETAEINTGYIYEKKISIEESPFADLRPQLRKSLMDVGEDSHKGLTVISEEVSMFNETQEISDEKEIVSVSKKKKRWFF